MGRRGAAQAPQRPGGSCLRGLAACQDRKGRPRRAAAGAACCGGAASRPGAPAGRPGAAGPGAGEPGSAGACGATQRPRARGAPTSTSGVAAEMGTSDGAPERRRRAARRGAPAAGAGGRPTCCARPPAAGGGGWSRAWRASGSLPPQRPARGARGSQKARWFLLLLRSLNPYRGEKHARTRGGGGARPCTEGRCAGGPAAAGARRRRGAGRPLCQWAGSGAPES